MEFIAKIGQRSLRKRYSPKRRMARTIAKACAIPADLVTLLGHRPE
jgi:hypothetical protein